MHINVHTQQSRREGEGDREEGAAVRIAGEKGGGGGGGEKRPRFASLPASISSSRGEWKSGRKGGVRSFVRWVPFCSAFSVPPLPPSGSVGSLRSAEAKKRRRELEKAVKGPFLRYQRGERQVSQKGGLFYRAQTKAKWQNSKRKPTKKQMLFRKPPALKKELAPNLRMVPPFPCWNFRSLSGGGRERGGGRRTEKRGREDGGWRRREGRAYFFVHSRARRPDESLSSPLVLNVERGSPPTKPAYGPRELAAAAAVAPLSSPNRRSTVARLAPPPLRQRRHVEREKLDPSSSFVVPSSQFPSLRDSDRLLLLLSPLLSIARSPLLLPLPLRSRCHARLEEEEEGEEKAATGEKKKKKKKGRLSR